MDCEFMKIRTYLLLTKPQKQIELYGIYSKVRMSLFFKNFRNSFTKFVGIVTFWT